MVHVLKILPESYDAVESGRKRSEVRFYDRDYLEGDLLVLQEYDVLNDRFTGRVAVCEITHTCSSDSVKDGYIVLSFKLIYANMRHNLTLNPHFSDFRYSVCFNDRTMANYSSLDKAREYAALIAQPMDDYHRLFVSIFDWKSNEYVDNPLDALF